MLLSEHAALASALLVLQFFRCACTISALLKRCNRTDIYIYIYIYIYHYSLLKHDDCVLRMMLQRMFSGQVEVTFEFGREGREACEGEFFPHILWGGMYHIPQTSFSLIGFWRIIG